MKGGWGYENGHANGSSQDSGSHVTVAHVHQHARTQPDALEGVAVGPQCHLIVAATLVVAPGARIHTRLCKGFIIKDIHWFHNYFLSTGARIHTRLRKGFIIKDIHWFHNYFLSKGSRFGQMVTRS